MIIAASSRTLRHQYRFQNVSRAFGSERVRSDSPALDPPDTSITSTDTTSESSRSSNGGPKNLGAFPWRHSAQPLDRFIPDHPDFRKYGPSGFGWPAYVEYMNIIDAGLELGIPVWRVILTSGWQQELAGQFAWAFHRAVSALSSVEGYLGGSEKNDDRTKQQDIKIETNIEDNPSITDVKTNETKSSDAHDSSIYTKELLQSMLEQKLYELYENAREFGKSNIQVKLETKPIDWSLINAYVIPYVTRDDVRRDESLKHVLRDVRRDIQDAGDVNLGDKRQVVENVNRRLMNRLGHENRTVVVQAQINCLESFMVQDLDTKEIIQGDGSEQMVTHTVRFEMVTTAGSTIQRPAPMMPLLSIFGGKKESRDLGSWIISDWDDILDGNNWMDMTPIEASASQRSEYKS